ncbi:MAG: RNA polymerase sigma factor [Solirubrobacterales bacterium]
MGRKSTLPEALRRELAEARFSSLYREHGREIMGYALRRTAGPEDAADALAETFLVAWRRLADVPAGGEARLWLYGTARRVLANQRRAEGRRTRLAEVLREALWQGPDTLSAPDRDRAGLMRALAELDSADRELLMLIGWEELTPAEAGRVLEISPLATRTRLHRARRRLRSLLADQPTSESATNEPEVEEAR